MATSQEPTSLADHLAGLLSGDRFAALRDSVVPALVDAIAGTSRALRDAQQVALAGTANTFGDDQLNVDVLAENLIRDALATCPSVSTASSEEDPVERPAQKKDKDGSDTATAVSASDPETYTVAFDPLDGSSIIAPNWTVGTIIGVWQGNTALEQEPASRQIVSILGVYGPRTTAIIAIRIPGQVKATCFEVGINDDSGFNDAEIVRAEVKLSQPPFKTRYFAPANLRAAAEDERYMKLVTHYIQSKYTLRYSGGLVPDVVHALVKGHGIYVSPVTSASKAKLRRLYELFPLSLIVECAGGKAVDPANGDNILDRPLRDIDERGGLICGTTEEVDFVVQTLVQ
ncbi:fructose-1,6-bisphosphatase [Microdochium bolleyi]|uniref:Fructose-1,6-bisphosphatase n=1 Tax=Microdochium bolleyi TaxID=196109 RepID=A0A136J9A2_9PEZI|nr:fructose-1,6-bisphosphatase [Microdochium bolleyi]